MNDIECDTVSESPWKNVYVFARMLINSDKYASIGKETTLLSRVCGDLRDILADRTLSDETKLARSKKIFEDIRDFISEKESAVSKRRSLFFDDMMSKLRSITDLEVFIVSVECILLPINEALKTVPNNDREYTVFKAQAYLDKYGDDALSTVLMMWDDAGVEGCLDAERTAVLNSFSELRRNIPVLPEAETDMILTAFVQEFERRLSQKRKSRAGGSLEDVTSFLFKYYKIKAADSPEHFESDIEIDKWVSCKDKWLIGISCKRTLRERWKQVSSATKEILSKHKIKEVWHITTYDEDLSDDKLAALGQNRHIFYLQDESRKYKLYKDHIGLKDYVRPMSGLIDDLEAAIGRNESGERKLFR